MKRMICEYILYIFNKIWKTTDSNAVYNVYIYKFNLPGGGDNKHSSAKYNKAKVNSLGSLLLLGFDLFRKNFSTSSLLSLKFNNLALYLN